MFASDFGYFPQQQSLYLVNHHFFTPLCTLLVTTLLPKGVVTAESPSFNRSATVLAWQKVPWPYTDGTGC